MNDEKWERHVEKARQENEKVKQVKEKQTDTKSNLFFALLSPMCLVLAFFLPNLAELLLFSVWSLGSLCSFGILVTYAHSDNVSQKVKEGALSFLLGNLFVFFVFLLKPT